MNQSTPIWRRYAVSAAGLGLVLVAFGFSRYPRLDSAEAETLAARFRFSKAALPEVANHPPYKHVRQVHPSLERISGWISSLGAAVTLADLDGDGLPNDVCYVDPRTDLITVTPAPETGQRYAPFALDPAPLPYTPDTMAPMGTVAGDFNEDGQMDLLAYFWGRTPVLFLRHTPATHPQARPLDPTHYARQELVQPVERWFSNGATQADLDGDGHVDLVIGNYFQDGAHILDSRATGQEVMHEGKGKALNGGKKHFFLWQTASPGPQPSVHFSRPEGFLPEEINRGWTLAVGAADLDGDLLPEIYFSFDFGPDRLLHNRSSPGQLRFVPLTGRRSLTTPKSCALGQDSFKGMGCDFGDVNGDGFLDIYVSNIATKFGLTESHFLWLSTGQPELMQQGVAPYRQSSEQLGLSRSGWGWESRLADFDNDGVLEAIQAVGFLKGDVNRWPELQALGTSNDGIIHNPKFWPTFKPGADLSGHDTNPFFVRARDGRYYDIAPQLGLAEPLVTKGIATADVDGDGRLDFALANQWEPSFFVRNLSPTQNQFLGLHLLHPLGLKRQDKVEVATGHPTAANPGRPAIGAVARILLPDGRQLVGAVDGGAGHSGRRSPDLHFGLGKLDPSARIPVELRWRDTTGRVRQERLELPPGWHTVLLANDQSAAVAELITRERTN